MPTNIKMPLSDVSLYQPVDAEDNDASSGFCFQRRPILMQGAKMEPSFDALVQVADRLCEDLSPGGRRRLFFLLRTSDGIEPRESLALAAQMENFVSSEPACGGGHGSAANRVDSRDASRDPTAGRDSCEPSAREAHSLERTAPPAANGADQLSRGVPRKEFLDAIGAGATNHQLAVRFGLTLRQANGLRIGLARRKSAKLGGATSVPGSSRFVRRKQHKTCLGQNTAQPEIIEEVVRYLRQTGDVVVRSGDNYLINARHIMTVMELVDRANRKREEQGRPLFCMDTLHNRPPPSQAA